MNTLRHFAAILLIGMFGWPSQGHAQCTSTLELEANLAAGESASASILLTGDLSSFTVNLNFSGGGGSFPGDMLISVFAPDSSCVGWGGYSYGVTNGCTDLGSGFAGTWPEDWSSQVPGFYTFTPDATDWGLSGSGVWVVEVENAYTYGGNVTYDLEFLFEGPCEPDCPDPDACNYVPEEDQLNPLDEACVYPEDLCGDCGGAIDAGCIDDAACNYNSDASCDDGSCLYGESGCTDSDACNYDCQAICDNGSCLYGEVGCTDSDAANFNPDASCDDYKSCYYRPLPKFYCGQGTTWDLFSGKCIGIQTADVDLSGCVGMNDLLELLAHFNACEENTGE